MSSRVSPGPPELPRPVDRASSCRRVAGSVRRVSASCCVVLVERQSQTLDAVLLRIRAGGCERVLVEARECRLVLDDQGTGVRLPQQELAELRLDPVDLRRDRGHALPVLVLQAHACAGEVLQHQVVQSAVLGDQVVRGHGGEELVEVLVQLDAQAQGGELGPHSRSGLGDGVRLHVRLEDADQSGQGVRRLESALQRERDGVERGVLRGRQDVRDPVLRVADGQAGGLDEVIGGDRLEIRQGQVRWAFHELPRRVGR